MLKKSWYMGLFLLLNSVAQDPIANLPQGRIVGIKVYNENSLIPIEIFFGIPYAIPPVGRYRFTAPERHLGWKRTFFAHRMPPRCPQFGDDQNGYVSEDCLFLNVWAPRRSDGGSMPVVVILYSETWERGGIALPCQELAAEGVVVVTVAYRLHILSFFTLRSMGARGNLGILDQYMALLWVRDNIAAFGGDPTAITLHGHSAGADSVLYHLASPRSIGLFQRAIIMSPHDIWAAIDKNMNVNAVKMERISRDVARALGCTSHKDLEILTCIRAKSLSDIMAIYSNSSWAGIQPAPDNYLPEAEQYLPAPLSVALSSEKQPMQLDLLMGTTNLEIIDNNEEDFNELSKREAHYLTEYVNTKAIPEVLQMFSLHRLEALSLLHQAIIWEYWGKSRSISEMDTLESIDALARMQSSAKWGAGSALLAARLARRVSQLFVYRYIKPGVDLHGQMHNFTGAVHGTDLVALLGDTFMLQVARRPANFKEKQMSSLFRKYIASFIKFGSPSTDHWQRYKAGDANIYDIGGDNININSASKEAAFWLQYLPQISNFVTSPERSELLASVKDETRLRGGVFAMAGLSVVLLLLLLVCILLLRKERAFRSSAADSHL